MELPCGGDEVTAGLLAELGVESERAGWDGVFEDHLTSYRGHDPSTFDPWLPMAVIAGRTTRLTDCTTQEVQRLARAPAGHRTGAGSRHPPTSPSVDGDGWRPSLLNATPSTPGPGARDRCAREDGSEVRDDRGADGREVVDPLGRGNRQVDAAV